MEERTLFDLQREVDELRVKLARVEAAMKRREDELWRQHITERHAAIAQERPRRKLDDSPQ